MPASVRIQPQGYSVKYPKASWIVAFVESDRGFRFTLSRPDFQFEPRDKYRYRTREDASRAASYFLELMKRLERSRMRFGVLAEIGVLKFPQEKYLHHQIWLLVDRDRYSWEAARGDGISIRAQYWYKKPETALDKAKAHIDWEIARSKIRDVIGWV